MPNAECRNYKNACCFWLVSMILPPRLRSRFSSKYKNARHEWRMHHLVLKLQTLPGRSVLWFICSLLLSDARCDGDSLLNVSENRANQLEPSPEPMVKGLSVPFVACKPDKRPNLRTGGFCSNTESLDQLCGDLEISVSSACTNFEGHFCCYDVLPRAATLPNSETNTYVAEGAVSLDAAAVRVIPNGLEFTIPANHAPRIYMTDTSKSKYQMINLDGTEVEFDVDLSHVPCGYNMALFFVAMSSSSSPGHGYCDAQVTPGCNEMDVLEANNLAVQFTAHPCWGPPPTCNRTGIFRQSKLQSIGIDPTKPFTVNSHWSGEVMRQRYSQNGKSLLSVQLASDPRLASLVKAFHSGMVLTMGLWTKGTPDGMAWLGGACKTLADRSTVKATITNLSIRPFV